MLPEVHAVGHTPHLAHHFESMAKQTHAVRLGMWLFLATEVLLFAGLFTGYAVYRFLYPGTFQLASQHLDVTLGTVNTVVLITSSFTVAMGLHFASHGKNRAAAALLWFSVACGAAFLVVKGFEYAHKFHEGALPGRHYAFAALGDLPGASMFFTVYFCTTGLHAVHVVIGMCLLAWLATRAMRGHFSPDYYTPVELGGLYWHLVDLVWIFLFPLLYLV